MCRQPCSRAMPPKDLPALHLPSDLPPPSDLQAAFPRSASLPRGQTLCQASAHPMVRTALVTPYSSSARPSRQLLRQTATANCGPCVAPQPLAPPRNLYSIHLLSTSTHYIYALQLPVLVFLAGPPAPQVQRARRYDGMARMRRAGE